MIQTKRIPIIRLIRKNGLSQFSFLMKSVKIWFWRTFMVVFSLTFWACNQQHQEVEKVVSKNHISGEIHLNPSESYLKAHLNFFFKPFDVQKDTLTFFLHEGVEIESLVGENVDHFEVVPAENVFGMERLPFTNFLKIIRKEKALGLNFEMMYKATIPIDQIILGPDVFMEDWFELGVGSVWFPLYESLNLSFTHNIMVTVPEEYTITGIGQFFEKGKGSYQIISPYESVDIVLVGSKDLLKKEIEMDEIKTEIFYTIENEKHIDGMLSQSHSVLSFYNKTFGFSDPRVFQKIVLPPDRNRAKAEGYSRNPFIMLNTYTDSMEVFKFIAHEAAHFWWNKGVPNTEDNFINESFAEFSYMLAVREMMGDYFFQEVLEDKENHLKEKELPSILEAENSPQHNYDLFYVKGVLVLSQLEEKIGQKAFIDLLRNSIAITTLDEFVDLINKQHGSDLKSWFISKL